jgi:hypothetical protein
MTNDPNDTERPLEISWIGRGMYTVHDWNKGKVFEGSLDECRSFVRQQDEARIDEVNKRKVREALTQGISREELQVQEYEKYLRGVVAEKFPNVSAEERARLYANVDREVAEYRQALAQQQPSRPLAEWERYECELRARVEEKYPSASRTPELDAKIEAKIQRLVEQHIDESNLKKAHQAGIRGRSFDEFKKELLKAKTVAPAPPALDRARQQQRAQEIER